MKSLESPKFFIYKMRIMVSESILLSTENYIIGYLNILPNLEYALINVSFYSNIMICSSSGLQPGRDGAI